MQLLRNIQMSFVKGIARGRHNNGSSIQQHGSVLVIFEKKVGSAVVLRR